MSLLFKYTLDGKVYDIVATHILKKGVAFDIRDPKTGKDASAVLKALHFTRTGEVVSELSDLFYGNGGSLKLIQLYSSQE